MKGATKTERDRLISRIQQEIEDVCKLDAENEGFLWEILLNKTGQVPFSTFSMAILDLFDEHVLENILIDITDLLDDDIGEDLDIPDEG